MASIRGTTLAARACARPRLASPAPSSLASTSFLRLRSLHHRVPLPYAQQQGIPGFLSPEALHTVAVEWQDGLLARLNDLVRGSELENLSVLQTLKQAAPDPSKTLAFNYASEALNNSFFLSTLSPTPSGPSPSSSFSQALASLPSLGSFTGLVSHMSAHVAGLHPASGAYVWLVTDPSGNLGVVGTYAGGTVLVKERHQMGHGAYAGRDLRILGERVEVEGSNGDEAAPATASAGEAKPEQQQQSAWEAVSSPAARKGASSSSAATLLSEGALSPSSILSAGLSAHHGARVGQSLHPLACISVHPHCYLGDYGLWGRDEYVRKWWTAVDWKKVEDAFDAFTRKARV
ncbi:hypothetical protein JCM9279_003076 [Rhodotorula babjevae]